jgi:uncharacterized tellurite resistance protein B-like protein
MNERAPSAAALELFAAASDAELEAGLELMYLVAKADGFVAADELRQFLRVARALPGGRLDTARLSALLDTFKARGAVEIRARSAELGAVLGTPALRRAAYELAAAIVTADGELREAEVATLEAVGEALGLP